MSAVPGPPQPQGGGNECDHCRKLLRGTKPRGEMLEPWVKKQICDCAPFDDFACTCSCGRAPTTHVVEVASKSLVPWCGRKECKRVAAMSYRWPAQWSATPPSIEVRGCAGCGQQPGDGPFARKDEQLAVMSSEYEFLWVDHWCTRGCADIPRLQSVYQQSDKIAIPLDDEHMLGPAKLVALCIGWCLVLPYGLAWRAYDRVLDVILLLLVAYPSRPCLQQAVRWGVALPMIACLQVSAAVVGLPLRLVAAVGHCLEGSAQGRAPRSKRLWLRVESAYTRTHAVLLPSGLARGRFKRMSIEVLAREWSTWFWFPYRWGGALDLSKCDVYSVSDLFLVELLGGLDVNNFVDKAVEAGQENSSARDPSLPRWLPSNLGALYKPDTLMGRVIEVKYIPGAAEVTLNGEPRLLVRVRGGTRFLKLVQDAEAGGVFAVVGYEIGGFEHVEVPVTCRRLSTAKL